MILREFIRGIAAAFILLSATVPHGADAQKLWLRTGSGSAPVVNSCWDTATLTNVNFTNGNCTATLAYGGEDLHFELTPANKAGPTISYFEIRMDAVNASGNFGVPIARIGAFLFNRQIGTRPGFEVYSLGSTYDGTMTHSFASIWTTDSKLTFATSSIISIVTDSTDPLHPLFWASNDGVTYRGSGNVLNDMATCCGGTLPIYGGGSLFVNGDSMTILTGTAVTRSPPTGLTTPNPTVLP